MEAEKQERRRREEFKLARKEEPVKEDSWRRNGREEKDTRRVGEDRAFHDQKDKRGFKDEADRCGPSVESENWAPRKEKIISDERGPKDERSLHKLRLVQTTRDIRSIIVYFSYFRGFSPQFAEVAGVIINLMRGGKNQKVEWLDIHEEALNKLKRLLVESVTLYTIDYQREFGLAVDASAGAVGCCLFQLNANREEQPIAFASAKLSDTQQRWATIEREAYAVVWALQKFKGWLLLSQVTVFSDHNPLTFLTEVSTKSSKLTRWALALQEFDLQFKYRAGRTNIPADFMSRSIEDDGAEVPSTTIKKTIQ